MSRFFKIVFLFSLVVISLPLMLSAFVNQAQVKSAIEHIFLEQTGRTLLIDGPLSVDFSIIPTVSAKLVRISNTSWGKNADAVTVDRIRISLSLMEIIKGTLLVKRVELDGPVVHVEYSDSGESNLSIFSSHSLPSNELTVPGWLTLHSVRANNGVVNIAQSKRDIRVSLEMMQLDVDPFQRTVAMSSKGTIQEKQFQFDAGVDGDISNLKDSAMPVVINGALENASFSATGSISDLLEWRDVNMDVELNIPTSELLADLGELQLPTIENINAKWNWNKQDGKSGLKMQNINVVAQDEQGKLSILGEIDNAFSADRFRFSFSYSDQLPNDAFSMRNIVADIEISGEVAKDGSGHRLTINQAEMRGSGFSLSTAADFPVSLDNQNTLIPVSLVVDDSEKLAKQFGFDFPDIGVSRLEAELCFCQDYFKLSEFQFHNEDQLSGAVVGELFVVNQSVSGNLDVHLSSREGSEVSSILGGNVVNIDSISLGSKIRLDQGRISGESVEIGPVLISDAN